MNPIASFIGIVFIAVSLSGCLASTTSSNGISCNSATEKGPVWDWPLICQPNGG